MFRKVNGKKKAPKFNNEKNFNSILARERIVGWYHTGPKLHRNDISINELIREYHPDSVLVIIDAKPKDLGLPTEAYIAVEEIHDVRKAQKKTIQNLFVFSNDRMEVQLRKLSNIYHRK
jgi:hypothetical protein